MKLFSSDKAEISELYYKSAMREVDYERAKLNNEIKAWEERKNTMLLEEIKKRGWQVLIN